MRVGSLWQISHIPDIVDYVGSVFALAFGSNAIAGGIKKILREDFSDLSTSEMAQSKLQLALLLAAVASSAGFSIGAGPLRLRSGSQASSVAASTALSSGILMQDTDAGAEASAAPAAYIEFIVGYPEPVVPDVSLTRSRDGSTGVATFTFDNPSFLAAATQDLGETTGAAAL